MIRIHIANEEREVASNIDALWINQQINMRRAKGQIVAT
jgi:hypothetical protein